MFLQEWSVQEELSLQCLQKRVKKSSVLLLGPGPQNQLGLVPGNINLTDGKNSITIDTPGLAGIMTK